MGSNRLKIPFSAACASSVSALSLANWISNDVLSLHVAKRLQASVECLDVRRLGSTGVGDEQSNPRDVLRLLRLGNERRHQEAEGEGDEEAEGAGRHGGVLQTTQRDRQPEGSSA